MPHREPTPAEVIQENKSRAEILQLIPPDPVSEDLYIGRLLLGTEAMVEQLGAKLDPAHVISAHGRLVLPYMHRHILAGVQERQEYIAGEMLDEIYAIPISQLLAILHDPHIKEQASGKAYSLRVPYTMLDPIFFRTETDRAFAVLKQHKNVDTRSSALAVRAYETTDHEEAQRSQVIADGHVGHVLMSVPVICGAPKK